MSISFIFDGATDRVSDEGHGLRAAAIAAICLLSQIAMVEGDYDTAETHCRALQAIMSQRSERLPGAVRQFLVGTDLRLTGVHVRAPLLSQQLHPNFRVPGFHDASSIVQERVYSNLRAFPNGSLFPKDNPAAAQRILYGLHDLAMADSRTDIHWTALWGHINAVAYLLAELQVQAESNSSLEEKVALVGCQMQFWGMTSAFVPQAGIQSHQLSRLSNIIASLDPIELSTRWLRSTGSLELLLWILCDAVIAALHHQKSPQHSDDHLPSWLWCHIMHVMGRLNVRRAEDLEACLRNMPFTESWNRIACRCFDDWLRSGADDCTLAHDYKVCLLPDLGLYRNLRLNFDVNSAI